MKTGRLILAGGSGFLGSALTRYFLARGWGVTVLSRGANVVIDGAQTAQWDGETLGAWGRELEGADALINLAGVSVNCRYGARNRKLILDSRVNSTRILGAAIAQAASPPPVWLNSSTATIYKHTYGSAWDERGEIGGTPEAKDEFSVEVACAWERALNEARTPATRKIALRSAMVLGSGPNSIFPMLRRLVLLGLGGKMGHGAQFVSWIHEEDFCRAIDWLLNHEEISGPVNVAAPNPVTNTEMMRILREICGRRFGLPASRWMLEVGAFFLRTETELIIKSRRVVPGRFLASGFGFGFQHLREAFQNLSLAHAHTV